MSSERSAAASPAASSRGIAAQTLAARIDAFLASRGYRPPDAPAQPGTPSNPPATPKPIAAQPSSTSETPAEFVCEDDVRAALKAGKTVLIGEKTIITPSARELGEEKKVFVHTGWPR